jgi:hypothetical protein
MKKLLVLLVGLVGCGGGSSGNDATKAWVGSWVSAVTQTQMCTTQTMTSLDGTFTIAQGSTADVITTQAANGCNLNWTVVGDTAASLASTQMCTVPGSVGGTWDATFTEGVLTLTNGQITVGDNGTAVLTLDGAMTNCTFTQAGNFNKG